MIIKSNSYNENSFRNIQNNLIKQKQKINNNNINNDNMSSHKIFVNKKIFTFSNNKINVSKKKPITDTNTTSNTSTSRERNSNTKISLSPFYLHSPKITNNNLTNNQGNKIKKKNTFYTPKKIKKDSFQYSTLTKKTNNDNNYYYKYENKNKDKKIIHNYLDINNSKQSTTKILDFIKKKKRFELSFTSPVPKNKKSNNSSIETSYFKTDCIRDNEDNKIYEENSNENEENILLSDLCFDFNSKQFEDSDYFKNSNLDSFNNNNTYNNTIFYNTFNNNRNTSRDIIEKDKNYLSPKKTVRNFGINQLMKLSYNFTMNDIKIKKNNPIRNFTSFSDQKIIKENSIKESFPFSINNISNLSNQINNNGISFNEQNNNIKKINHIKTNTSRYKCPIKNKLKDKKIAEYYNKINIYENKLIKNKPGIHKLNNNTFCLSKKINISNNSININSNTSFQGKIENYILGKELGKGSFALVRLSINKITKEKFAIKIYPKFNLLNFEKRNTVKNEISVLKQLDHENIMKLYEVIDTPKNLYLILEYINGISLIDYMKNLSGMKIKEDKCKKIFYQIVNAINYCKSKNIYHRDIKLENILLVNEKLVKIIDFGFSIKCPKNTYQKFLCGTPNYMSPEIINKHNYIPEYSDIWSLGVLLFIMLTGTFPFKANTEEVLCKKVNKGEFIIPKFLSQKCHDLIKKMLVFEPNKRISTETILCHEWFS